MTICTYMCPADVFRNVAGLLVLHIWYYNFGTSSYSIGQKNFCAFGVYRS